MNYLSYKKLKFIAKQAKYLREWFKNNHLVIDKICSK